MSVHPFLAKSFATPAPRPDPAPVTKATSPFSSVFIYFFFQDKFKNDVENCPLKYLQTYTKKTRTFKFFLLFGKGQSNIDFTTSNKPIKSGATSSENPIFSCHEICFENFNLARYN